MDENPLSKQLKLEQIAKEQTLLCDLNDEQNTYYNMLKACFKAKSQGVDECINVIDSMLHSNKKFLNQYEKDMLERTLHNVRSLFASRREVLIKQYDEV